MADYLPAPRARCSPGAVLDEHTHRLRVTAEQNAGDARFCSGVAWGLYALERVRRAIDGSTDPAALGLSDPWPASNERTPT